MITFKKGTVIISKKDYKKTKYGNSQIAILLSEDFTPEKDSAILYSNLYHVVYRPRKRNVIINIYPEYRDGYGGQVAFISGEVWYAANKKITNWVDEIEKEIKEELK